MGTLSRVPCEILADRICQLLARGALVNRIHGCHSRFHCSSRKRNKRVEPKMSSKSRSLSKQSRLFEKIRCDFTAWAVSCLAAFPQFPWSDCLVQMPHVMHKLHLWLLAIPVISLNLKSLKPKLKARPRLVPVDEAPGAGEVSFLEVSDFRV